MDPTSQLRTQNRMRYQRTLGDSDSGCRRPVETTSLLPWPGSGTASQRTAGILIRLQRIYNFLCSMLVFTPFAYCFVTLSGTFMHFPELTY
jgi:hypothetical protein